MTKLDLSSPRAYMDSARSLARRLLSPYGSVSEVESDLETLNRYPGLDALEEPGSVRFLEEEGGDLESLGKEAVLEGSVYWEHTAAGEATRLGLGPKFFLKPEDLLRESPEGTPESAPSPGEGALIPLELGRRHLFQLVYELKKLAHEAGEDPLRVLSRQKMLVVAAGEGALGLVSLVAKDFRELLPSGSLHFMIQRAFPGLARRENTWDYDPDSPPRLHNHGAMVMQKTMDGQIFTEKEDGGRVYLSRGEYLAEMEKFKDLVSYNIEDLDYLTRALDFAALGLAVKKRGEYGMMMEIVANNPERPVKGGCLARDPALKKDVMIESFRLQGYRPEDIRFLNKNFNHYLHPARLLETLRREGLFMPLAVRDGRVHFQPVQGDMNFLENTLFFARKKTAPLNSLKSRADIPAALEAFAAQDAQPGFRETVGELVAGA
ncbi:MAG: hypothetical protein LBR53_04835 [Deltaproteobacteria bacterium]|jgi:hypothetical protein|nr:hypothetical protein [Deltaproteobacteria bacterium]